MIFVKKFVAGGCPAASYDGGAPEPRLSLIAQWSNPSALVSRCQQKSMVSPELARELGELLELCRKFYQLTKKGEAVREKLD